MEKIENNRANREQMAHTFLNELPRKEGAIDIMKLQKIGRGGTHDVFACPNNTAFVIKLNRNILDKILSTNESRLSEEMLTYAEEHIKNENSKYSQLYQHFGSENCLREQILLQKINIEINDKPREIETLISVQESSNVFSNPDKVDFGISYAENALTKETEESYKAINTALMGSGEFDENIFLQFNNRLEPTFKLIDEDQDFKDTVKKFLLNFKKYFDASGNFIDLVGEENVLFYKKDGKWAFQIGSVLKAESKQNVEKALEMLNEDPKSFNKKNRNNLKNGLALIRLLNAVGIKTGIGKIIDIQLNTSQLNNLVKVIF